MYIYLTARQKTIYKKDQSRNKPNIEKQSDFGMQLICLTELLFCQCKPVNSSLCTSWQRSTKKRFTVNSGVLHEHQCFTGSLSLNLMIISYYLSFLICFIIISMVLVTCVRHSFTVSFNHLYVVSIHPINHSSHQFASI